MEQKLKKLVLVLAVLGLVGFLANLLVDNPYTHRFIRTTINDQVKTSTNLVVDFKAIKLSVVPPGADLYGFYLATNVAPDSPLVTAAHVKARLSLWSALFGQIKLSVFEAGDLTVIWPPPWNFKGFLKNPAPAPQGPESPPAWPPDFEIPINSVVLSNAKAYFETPLTLEGGPLEQSPVAASVVGFDLDLGIDGWNDMDVDLKIKSANVAIGATSMLEETGIELRGTMREQKFSATQLKVDGERIHLDGNAQVAIGTQGKQNLMSGIGIQVDGRFKGDMSLLGSFLDVPDTFGPATGEVRVKADVPLGIRTGDPTFEVDGKGQVHDAQLAGFHLLNSKAAFHITPQAVQLNDVEVIQGETTFGKGSGEIRLTDSIDFEFKVVPDGLHLVDLLDALGVGFALVDTEIRSPNLRLWGHGVPLSLNVSATAEFSRISLPETPYDHSKYPRSPDCRFDFHLAVTSIQLDFNGTRGVCYQPDANAQPAMPPAGHAEPPKGATNASPVDFAGQIKFEGKENLGLLVHSDALDLGLAPYFSQIPMAGSGALDARIHGPFEHVLIDVAANLQHVEIHKMPLGDVQAKVQVDGKVLKWRDVVAHPEGGKGRIESKSGSLDLTTDNYQIKGKVAVKDVDQASIAKVVQSATEGGTNFGVGVRSLDADLEGPLFFPGGLRGKIAVGLEQAALDGEILFSSVSGTINLTDKGASSDDLVATLGDLALSLKFNHRRAKPFDHEVAGAADFEDDPWTALGLSPKDRFDAEFATLESSKDPAMKEPGAPADHLGLIPFAGPKLKEIGIKGQIVTSGKFSGSTGDLQGTFDTTIRRPEVFGSVMSPLRVKGFVKGSKIDAVITHSGNSFEGRLSLDVLKEGVPYEWFFNFNRMDLRALGTSFFHSDPRNFIYLTADWRMKGKFTDWWRSTGELDVKDLRAKYVQDIASQTKVLQLKQEQPVKVLFTKDGWRFDEDKDLYLTGRNVQLRLSMVDSRPPARIGIRAEGIVDMAIAKEFSQDIDTATGKLRIVAEINGSAENPDPTVEITDLKNSPFIAATWTPVTLGLADIRPPFRNVRLRILYAKGKLVIDTLAADKGPGTVTATGALNLTEDAADDESHLDINFNNATVIYPVAFLKSFETEMSGNVSVSGNGLPFKIAGDVVINRARSTREVDIRDEIINALRQKSFSASVVAEKPTVVFDLNVVADQSINIHNRNLQSILSADLQIKGNDIQPSVSGQVEIDKGKFIYKRDFQISRGLVTFDDPVKPDPNLDILAYSEVDNYRVYIAITGKASNPTVEFSVDPPTRESGTAISKLEILVLLSRGKLPEENRSLGQETQNAAASEAANLILGQFEEPVEKLFDMSGQSVVRNVYIDTHPSDGGPVPRLNLPLDLGEDIDIVLRADQTTKEVATEYNVHDNITFSGTLERKEKEDDKTTTSTATPQPKSGPISLPNNVDADAKLNLKFRFSFE